MIITLIFLVLLALLVHVLPIDGKVKMVFNYIIIALAILVFLFAVLPLPAEWSRWPVR